MQHRFPTSARTAFPRMTTGLLASAAALALTATAQAQSGSLVTTYDGGNAQDGNMFNIKVACDLTIDSFDVHFEDENNPAPCGSTCSVNEVEVYTATGGYVPIANDPNAWTLLGNVQHTITWGDGIPQPLSLPIGVNMNLASFKRTFYITNTGDMNTLTGGLNEFISYTNASSPGQNADNGDIEIIAGSGNDYPFGAIFSPRFWNGTIHYTRNSGCTGCTTDVVNYCTPGTSASGCTATLSAVGSPSISRDSGFIVYTTGFEGDKRGIFYSGQTGRQAAPWGNGTSFQCVTPPVKRSGIQDQTGTAGACDGWARSDLNAFWCPTCPKGNNPPVPGTKMQIQFWYRDPSNTSNQSTSLSDAIEVDICP